MLMFRNKNNSHDDNGDYNYNGNKKNLTKS